MPALLILLLLTLLPAGASGGVVGDLCDPTRALELDIPKKARQAHQELENGFLVFQSVSPTSLPDGWSGRRLRRSLFNLTILYWLQVKTDLCRCAASHAPPECAELPVQTRRSCELEPAMRTINVRCLTKGR